jgi:hypothetical protein
MKSDFRMRILALLGAASALALTACSQTTYGTGTSAGLQTVTDLVKAASLGEKKDPIDFNPRPPVVAPPSTASLPAPGSGSAGPGLAANWPTDSNQQAATGKQQIADAQASGRPIGIKGVKSSPNDQPTINTDDPNNYKTTPEQQAEVKRLLALSNSGGVDAHGVPNRQYLTDPPSGYLAPDPTAPPPSAEAQQKTTRLLKWPWQWFSKS